MPESKSLNIWFRFRNISLPLSQKKKSICNFFSPHSAQRCLETGERGVVQCVPRCRDLVLLEPPLVHTSASRDHRAPVFPHKTCAVCRGPRWFAGQAPLPCRKWLLTPRGRGRSREPPARWAGRSKSGVNRDEEWPRETSCVFSQGDVFSPLSSGRAI